MMRVARVNFGGDIKDRPAVVLNMRYGKAEVMKITSSCKMSRKNYVVPLSGLSGVKGYVETATIYTVPIEMIESFNKNKLFDIEQKMICKKIEENKKRHILKHISKI